MSVDVRTKTVIWELGDEGWDERHEVDPAAVRQAIDDERHVWIDMEGDRDSLNAALGQIVYGSRVLEGIDPVRASTGGQSPPEHPPKAKAFRNTVFGRAYWLGLSDSADLLVAQEIHVIAGRTFAITMRFPPVAWDIEGADLHPRPYTGDTSQLDT